MKTISIIIPNYNGVEVIKDNLSSVIDLSNKYKNIVEIIFIDDGSTDNSINFVRENFPDVKIITKSSNTGFVDSINLGVSKSKGDYVLLLNSDVKPDVNLIPNLLDKFDEPKMFAVGCLDKSVEGKDVIERGRGIGKFRKGFFIHQRGIINKHNTLWVSGGSGLYNKKIWNILSGLDGLYRPFYWEDIDLSYRALKSGYSIKFEPKAIAYHYHMQGSIKKNYSGNDVLRISFRNQLIFIWKNISDRKYLLSHFYSLPIFLISHILRGQFYYLFGFINALVKLPLILKSRKSAIKLFKIKDTEILELFKNG